MGEDEQAARAGCGLADMTCGGGGGGGGRPQAACVPHCARRDTAEQPRRVTPEPARLWCRRTGGHRSCCSCSAHGMSWLGGGPLPPRHEILSTMGSGRSHSTAARPPAPSGHVIRGAEEEHHRVMAVSGGTHTNQRAGSAPSPARPPHDTSAPTPWRPSLSPITPPTRQAVTALQPATSRSQH
jgi:hypothetical protein